MKHLNDEQLENIITNELTLVDYYADWCGPCKMLGMELEGLNNIQIIKVNTDQHQNLAMQKGIMSIPYVEIYKDQKIVTTFSGFKTKDEIEKILSEI